MKIDKEKFADKKSLLEHIKTNKEIIVAQKRNEIKKADDFCVYSGIDKVEKEIQKKNSQTNEDEIEVTAVMNSALFMEIVTMMFTFRVFGKKLLKRISVYFIYRNTKINLIT